MKPSRLASRTRIVWFSLALLSLVAILVLMAYSALRKPEAMPKTGVNRTVLAAPASASPPTSPYSNWQTYCDATTSGCIRYPDTWIFENYGSGNIGLLSPSKQVIASYSPSTGSGYRGEQTAAYQVVSIDNLAQVNPNLKVVGGVFAGNIPGYSLLGSQFIAQTKITTGRTSWISSIMAYANESGGTYGLLSLSPNAITLTNAQAQTWFGAAEVMTGKQILESFYFKT